MSFFGLATNTFNVRSNNNNNNNFNPYLAQNDRVLPITKEGVLLALSCQAFARLLLADLELVLWSRRVVA